MKIGMNSALCVCLCAGGIASADEPMVTLEPSNGHVVQAAHIYYNMATGEQVVTLVSDGQTAPAAGTLTGPIWSVLVRNPCADAGFTTEHFFGLDNNAGTSSLATAATLLDFGDIAVDTVVDCVHIDWVTGHNDVDSNGDGVGDGVVGLGGQWTWWDADNGRQTDACNRLPLISFMLIDLPGNIMGDGEMTGYTADIDLAGSLSSSLTFELGTTDHDSQGAAFFHDNIDTDGDGVGDGVPISLADMNFDSLPDSDLDGDGLFDWAWSVRFFQPGTADLDGDGVIDGDIADSMHTIGIYMAVPEGHAVHNNDGSWNWTIQEAVPDPGTGEEDAFAMFTPPNSVGGGIDYAGFLWFGGFSCSGVPRPDGPGYTPPAMFEHQLFGPGGFVCAADLNADGVLDFFDVSLFLSSFQGGFDYNSDGATDFFDVSSFLSDFNAGCP